MIFVKNIPFVANEQNLTELFGNYGTLVRVLVCPNKSIAIVEF